MNVKRTVAVLVPGFVVSTANAVTFNFNGANVSGPTTLLLVGIGLVVFAGVGFAWRRLH